MLDGCSSERGVPLPPPSRIDTANDAVIPFFACDECFCLSYAVQAFML